jgi:Zn finger protein HypA/HybF involved in hydrogenase expression
MSDELRGVVATLYFRSELPEEEIRKTLRLLVDKTVMCLDHVDIGEGYKMIECPGAGEPYDHDLEKITCPRCRHAFELSVKLSQRHGPTLTPAHFARALDVEQL